MTTMSWHDVMTLITWHDDDIQPYCISMRILESTQDFYLKFYGKIEISILPMNIINFPFVWCRDVMTSCHDVTKPDLPISACRCARKLILFLFPWFFRSLSSKMLLDFHLCDAVTSWRHVMTSLNLFYLSQLVDVLESWFFFCFHGFFYYTLDLEFEGHVCAGHKNSRKCSVTFYWKVTCEGHIANIILFEFLYMENI